MVLMSIFLLLQPLINLLIDFLHVHTSWLARLVAYIFCSKNRTSSTYVYFIFRVWMKVTFYLVFSGLMLSSTGSGLFTLQVCYFIFWHWFKHCDFVWDLKAVVFNSISCVSLICKYFGVIKCFCVSLDFENLSKYSIDLIFVTTTRVI